jgi:hypothetical protein
MLGWIVHTKWFKKRWFLEPKFDYFEALFSKEECNIILQNFEENAERFKLSKDHGILEISSYEMDVELMSKDVQSLIKQKIKDTIQPFSGGKVGMIFGVRYTLDTKPDMHGHYDCNTYSCVTELNDDFEGGGTYFPSCGELIRSKSLGDAYIFEADKINSYHEAYPVSGGVRYVLVIRMDNRGEVSQTISAILLDFISKYIVKHKDKLYKKIK